MSTNIISKNAQTNEGEIIFGVQGTLADFDALPVEQRERIIREGLVNFCCRTGKQKEELRGKTLSFAELGELLMASASASRDGEPTEKDEKAAKAWLDVETASAAKEAKLPGAFKDMSEKERKEYRLIQKHTVIAKFERNSIPRPGLQWTWQETNADGSAQDAHANAARLMRALRLWKPSVL